MNFNLITINQTMDFQKPKITFKELQQCCVSRGLKKSGLKSELIQRLENFEKERKSRVTKRWLLIQQYDSHLNYQIKYCWKYQQSNLNLYK